MYRLSKYQDKITSSAIFLIALASLIAGTIGHVYRGEVADITVNMNPVVAVCFILMAYSMVFKGKLSTAAAYLLTAFPLVLIGSEVYTWVSGKELSYFLLPKTSVVTLLCFVSIGYNEVHRRLTGSSLKVLIKIIMYIGLVCIIGQSLNISYLSYQYDDFVPQMAINTAICCVLYGITAIDR